MRKFIQQLHLPQHIRSIGPQLIHLEHHHLAGCTMCDLQNRNQQTEISINIAKIRNMKIYTYM